MATVVDVEQIKSLTKELIQEAEKNDTLHLITKRIIRVQLEEKMALEAGTLDAKEYKELVASAVDAALNATAEQADNAKEETAKDAESSEKKKATKRKTDSESAQSKKKSRTEAAEKKPKASKKARENVPKKGKAAEKNSKGSKVIRSASVVPSDDESGGEKETSDARSSKDTGDKTREKDTDGDVKMDDVVADSEKVDDSAPGPSMASSSKVTSDASTLVDRSANTPVDSNGDKSDSEMSVLIDDAPKRSRKRKGSGEAATTKSAKERGRKPKEATEESPQDQEIKRLKSFVVACGVRKVWSKEFKDISEDKSAQIRHLKSLLTGLGMTGRLSMEKAKSIREKRELAQELEDVQRFEKAVVSGPTPSRRAKRSAKVEESDEDEDEEEAAVPKPKTKNARASIMAFLQDQSDED